MTRQESFKRRIRARMAETGERYGAARRVLIDQAAAREQAASQRRRTWVAEPEQSDAAVLAATGRGYDDWCDLIEAWPGHEQGHGAVAEWLQQEHGVDGWWAQSVTVGWERITGRRLPHQQSDGTFTAGRSRTVAVDTDELQEAEVAGRDMISGLLRRLLVGSDELRLASEDGRASGSLRLLVPRDRSSPVLELSARGEDLKVSSTGKYVPGHKLSKKTLAWFDRAFVDGRVKSATVELKGPIRVFPFRNGEGTFDATAEVEDAALAYHDAWTPATGIDAEVTFHNQGMTARAKAAHVGGVATENAVAEIKDFKQNELRLSALASSDLQHAFEFLRASPLNTALGEQFERLEGQGCPINAIRVSDGLEPGVILFEPPEDDDPLGARLEELGVDRRECADFGE
jgi:hypothetical protein